MKIAIATLDGNTISSHFGRSPFFAIYNIENDKIIDKILRENTFTNHFKRDREFDSNDSHHSHHRHGHHGHGGVYQGLKDCQVVICRGMGQRAWEDLSANGMEVITTEESNCDEAVQRYLKSDLAHNSERLHKK